MNNGRRNEFLRRRHERMMQRGMMPDSRMDRQNRNPYGSRGGYVDSRGSYDSRGDRNMGRDGHMGSSNYYPEHYNRRMDEHYPKPYNTRGGMGYQYPREHTRPPKFEIYGVGGMRPYNDYGNEDMRDYRSENDYNYGQDYMGDYNYDMNSNNDYNYGRDYDYAGQNMEHEYKKKLHEWIEKLKSKDRFQYSKEQVIQQAKNMKVSFDEFDEDEFYAIYLMVISDYPTISNDYNIYISMAKDWLMDKDIKVSPSEKVCIYLYNIVLGEE